MQVNSSSEAGSFDTRSTAVCVLYPHVGAHQALGEAQEKCEALIRSKPLHSQ